MRAAALFALGLFACAPAETPHAALNLDCTLSYDALSKQILARPGLAEAREAGEPYRYLREGDGAVAYVFTEPGAPGHPAIFKQAAAREKGAKRMTTTGCSYGDEAGFDQVMNYLQSLS